MNESGFEKARKDAESVLEPVVMTLKKSILEIYMKGFIDGVRASEPSEEELNNILAKEEEFLSLVSSEEIGKIKEGVSVKLKKDAILQKRLKPEEFSVRVWNVLRSMEVNTLGDMVNHTQMDYIRQRNFGRVCLVEVIGYAHKYGYEIKIK